MVFILLWLSQVRFFVRRRFFRRSTVSHFWLAFGLVIAIGGLVNQAVLTYPSGTVGQIRFDAAAYSMVLISVMAVETVLVRWPSSGRVILERVIATSSVVFGILSTVFLLAPSGRTPPIADEWGRFAPFAANLHHTAMFLLPLPFVALAAGSWTEGRRRYRWTGLVAAPLLVIAALATGAVKSAIGLVVGVVVALSVGVGHRLGAGGLVGVFVGLLAIVLAVQTQTDLVVLAMEAFASADLSGARTFLYSEGIRVGMYSPIVGRGPGAHLEWDYAYLDAHQTFLTVFLQGGILGVLGLLAVVGWMGWRVRNDPLLAGALATIGVYAMGGDVMRRPSMWVFCVLIAHAAGRSGPRSVSIEVGRSAGSHPTDKAYNPHIGTIGQSTRV